MVSVGKNCHKAIKYWCIVGVRDVDPVPSRVSGFWNGRDIRKLGRTNESSMVTGRTWRSAGEIESAVAG